jgi:quercetin dioxygenase-like cupin family protein
MRVIHPEEAEFFMDGPEVCRQYTVTDKISFGTSTLLPGQTGGTDEGHTEGKEIFYCSRGHVAVYNHAEDKYYELKEGDILVISESEPHRISNIGETKAVVTWSCAPHM